MHAYIAIQNAKCTGCKTCELVCSLFHFAAFKPAGSAIRVVRREENGLVDAEPRVCQQCESPACVSACPTGAISRSPDGRMGFAPEDCIECGQCIAACPLKALAFTPDHRGVISCDLCGGKPQCIEACHINCLALKRRGET